MNNFTTDLLAWYDQHGRYDLPWKQDADPYKVWISEIMLQQTQVTTVIPYFERFMQRFPDLASLAEADLDEVLHLWSGLGYYSRARNLHKAARLIVSEHDSELPGQLDDLMALPGIGRSTAAAILALSMNQPCAILDGNVKRVLCRYHAIDKWPGERTTEKSLWALAEQYTSPYRPADYTQAIMDLGATICTRRRPACEQCPVQQGCKALARQLQDKLPLSKPRKVLPVRQTCFVMIENDIGEILLQRRPPTGVWGGLWGFPECPVDHETSAWVEQELGISIESISQSDQFRHTFSHFRLDITPVRARLISGHGSVKDTENMCWYNPAQMQAIGMASPVKKLVTTHYLSTRE